MDEDKRLNALQKLRALTALFHQAGELSDKDACILAKAYNDVQEGTIRVN